ncbi:hypothetical protein BZG36_03954 [Bifiguratus adelaidae]|uniref:CSC1/OSCA1-like 7TM region domain-containing protein n=1 Tax=Bifiguratus adelaidae TaxID=1938954 RepID=A0A261XZW5_9FUNG|nr:hypothetical protein BZG36_03954 [Bifiguratus adelaidae]
MEKTGLVYTSKVDVLSTLAPLAVDDSWCWPIFDPNCTTNSTEPPGTPQWNAKNTTGILTQLTISMAIAVLALLLFVFLRRHFPSIYMPRRHMKRNPPPKLPNGFLNWIVPLCQISHASIMEQNGLDAVVMLHFLLTAIKLFGVCTFFALVVLVPLNAIAGISNASNASNKSGHPGEQPEPRYLSSYLSTLFDFTITSSEKEANYLAAFLFFTWFFTFLAYYFLFMNYREYVRLRWSHLMHLTKTVPERTIMVAGIPRHLRTDKALAEYYESLNIGNVESAHVVRHVDRLKDMLEARAHYLRRLERAHAEYWGNPSYRQDYDPEAVIEEVEKRRLELLQNPDASSGVATLRREPGINGGRPSAEPLLPISHERKRPTVKTGPFYLFGPRRDAIEYFTEKFVVEDLKVLQARSTQTYKSTTVGFVTFEHVRSAVIASQTIVSNEPFWCRTQMAPEPRDVYWTNVTIRGRERALRELFVQMILVLLVFFWVIPIGLISILTSEQTIFKIMPPGFAKAVANSVILQSIVKGFLPTLAVIVFMALLPMIMEYLGKLQGVTSRSELEESTMSKYFFFLLFNVLLVFTIASTFWKTFVDIAHDPTSIPSILAEKLPSVAPYFVNYIILSGIGLMPLQLLLNGSAITRGFEFAFLCKTPREYAEALAPEQFKYGWHYPQPILVFIIVMVYSTIFPLILLFGTVYFCITYVVYKYQLLYVYFHPYESSGRAWPLVFSRIMVGMVIYHLTMTGLFLLRKEFVLGAFCLPLVGITYLYKYLMNTAYRDSSRYLPLEMLRDKNNPAICEDNDDNELAIYSDTNMPFERQRTWGEASLNVVKFSHVVRGVLNKLETPSIQRDVLNIKQRTLPVASASNVLDEDNYEAESIPYTDFREPPMTLFPGVLDTGLRRYAHPALIGALPKIWPPMKAGETNQLKKDRMRRKSRQSLAQRGLKFYGAIQGPPNPLICSEEPESSLPDVPEEDTFSIHKTYYHHPERRATLEEAE